MRMQSFAKATAEPFPPSVARPEDGRIEDGYITRQPENFVRPVKTMVPILAYHSVGAPLQTPRDRLYNISRAAFSRHLRLLKCLGYEGITLKQAYEGLFQQGSLPLRPVCITFDDAYRNVAHSAAPLLAEYGWPATVFVPTAYVGRSNVWDREEAFSERAIMEWRELCNLSAQGWEVGAHSRCHCRLSSLSEAVALEEIQGSKQDVENQVGAAISSFAYPYGDANAQLASLVGQIGFDTACTCEPRPMRGTDNPLLAPRIVIRRYNETIFDLVYRLSLRPRLDGWRKDRRSVVAS